ncbi:hypothetical protein BG003_004858 [Podila horticola]|nr:hypothetical protein BG003_004858 [Podila horticola]
MKITLLALAAVAILAQLAQAKESKVIPECLQTFKVPAKGYAEGGCCLLAKQYGVTFQDLLDWNTGLRKDCLNLDVGNYICVKAPKKAPATDAQGNPVPPAKCTLTMSPQTATTNPATKNNKPKPEVIATGPDMPKAQTKATRPLYPNTVPPKAALQQPPKPMAQGPKAVQQPPKPMTQNPKAAQQQPPKPMTQGPKAESVW